MTQIRPYTISDIPQLYEAARESILTVGAWLPWCHSNYKYEDSEKWVNASIEAFQVGSKYNFAIFSDNGHYLGGCGLNDLDSVNSRANLGYWIRTSATRNGVASDAAKLLINWAFQNTSLHRLEILVATGNHASLGVASKIGAFREGTLRERILIHGQYHDAAIFSVIKGNSHGA